MPEREFDVVLAGATGAAGRRAAAHLARRGADTRVALVGRSPDRLAALTEELGVDWPVLQADALDARALEALAERTRVVATAVGPFALLGMPLVEACADAGTHYCDLTGEILFMRASIDRVQERAAASGARIVHACGFDSVPSDLAVHLLARLAAEQDAGTPGRTRALVRGRGGIGGGTLDTARAQVDAVRSDPDAARVLADPDALTPAGADGRAEADRTRAFRDDLFGGWTAPWPLGPANMRVVRRSAALAGRDDGFRYDEGVPLGRSALSAVAAAGVAAGGRALIAGLGSPLVRPLLDGLLPSAGDVPAQRVLDAGWFRVDARTITGTGARLSARIAASLDPGYGATGALLAESALCLALDPLDSAPGVTTPSAAMGDRLVDRLRRAGFTAEARRHRAPARLGR
ncbi:saccharopine dehydrogenase family protein [Amnibacterium endophyticum]|uniref:Saccharopine dehydrogenase family protein n=1 Tax=Amnibacterium endophyticum TaxID=2109337 RepID=A0ABW4LB14_9MICO